MLTSLVELAERIALRTSPQRAIERLGLIPRPALDAMRRARFWNFTDHGPRAFAIADSRTIHDGSPKITVG